jgi:hypothetical protein
MILVLEDKKRKEKRIKEGRTYIDFKEVRTYVDLNIGRTNVDAD